MGHRNPQGIAWDAAGRLYLSNNGPTGEFGLLHNDEIDLIQPGQFYGWPVQAGRVLSVQWRERRRQQAKAEQDRQH